MQAHVVPPPAPRTVARRSTCDAAFEAAHRPTLLPTTAISAGGLGVYRHLRLEERRTRQGSPCWGHLICRQCRTSIGLRPLAVWVAGGTSAIDLALEHVAAAAAISVSPNG